MSIHAPDKTGGLSARALQDAAAPISRAQGLPNWLYADPEALKAEKATLFAPGWAGIGFAKDVPLYVAAEEPRNHSYFKPLIEHFDTVVFFEDLLDENKAFRRIATTHVRHAQCNRFACV